jgi:hypothetical protein
MVASIRMDLDSFDPDRRRFRTFVGQCNPFSIIFSERVPWWMFDLSLLPCLTLPFVGALRPY